jgi:histidine triad (HIT) family protein
MEGGTRDSMPRMHGHASQGYECPFCRVVAGLDCADNWTRQTDVVWRDGVVTAFVNAAF